MKCKICGEKDGEKLQLGNKIYILCRFCWDEQERRGLI